MTIHILTNSVSRGDAVSAHCRLLRDACAGLGHKAHLIAAHADPGLKGETGPLDMLTRGAGDGDLLLYQFFHYSPVACWADSYPGRRVMMYHNITPPDMAGGNEGVARDCALGLDQLRGLAPAFDAAYGMSEFSRGDLNAAGYESTGVFPLLIDLDRLAPPPIISPRSPVRRGTRFVFVGRLAPNKRQDRLIGLLAAWKAHDPESTLTLIGDDAQHPHWRRGLSDLCRRLGLREGADVFIPGKISDDEVRRTLLDSHVFVSASEHEGFGAPLIEAMAFGLPVFAFPAAAVPETLGGAGHLLMGETEREWASEIRQALEDSHSRWALHAAQMDRIEEFNPEAARRRVAALIDEITALPQRCSYRPRVSVVINTYNRGWWLDRCISSLEAQTYSNFEVIAVNGPSTDSTGEVLERWRGRVKSVSTQSRVLSVSRNEGIAAAAGDLVAFIDDDAVADPRWLERLAPAFLDPKTGGAGGLVYRMNGRDIEFSCGTLDREGFVEWNRAEPGRHFDWSDGRLNTVSGNNCIFRRSALERIGGFDERIEYYHDEADIVWRLERAGYRTIHRPNAIVYHEAARSRNRTGRHQLNWYAIVKNTVYCALKNYSGALPRPAAAVSILKRVHKERIREIGRWCRQGEISRGEASAYRWAAWRGAVTGLWRGWRRQQRLRRLPEPGEGGFLEFAARPVRMRVCLLSQSLPWVRPGGIATYTWELARGLRQLGCEVHLVSADAGAGDSAVEGVWIHKPAESQLPPGVPMDPGTAVTSKNLAYSWAVHRTISGIDARFGLDLVESPNWDAEGVVTAIDQRLPVVVRAHSPLSEVAETQGWVLNQDLRLAIALERRLSAHANMLTGSTRAIAGLAERLYQTGPDRMRRIPLGLGVDSPAPEPGRVDPSHPLVLFAGRLETRKGIGALTEAIERLLPRERTARYVIAGDDSAGIGKTWMEKLRRRDSAAAARVEVTGPVSAERLRSLYGECSLFVAPSLWESFGLVLLEAMAQGKPVVGTSTGGIPEVVEDGVTGILVEPGDAGALADAILELLGDPDRRAAMGRAGLARWRQRFSREAMARRTLEAYRATVAAWHGSRRYLFQAGAADLLRPPDTSIVWSPSHRCLALRSEGSGWRTVTYGPYMRVPAGRWRAEFMIWAEGETGAGQHIAQVEAFCGPRGICHSAGVMAGDIAGGGAVAQVFFDLEEAVEDFEFRVHGCSPATVLMRELRVSACPAGAYGEAQADGQRHEGEIEEVFA
ncbi:MAG: hypothetical protein C0504_02140 [Candidatus Solibacter sp.]|nr:hypothetical protein [Candidatus Solibacter sp.]